MFKFKIVAVAALLGACLALGIAAGASAADPARLQMNIPRVDKAPVLDGKLDDAAWLQASIKGGKFISDVSSTGTTLVEFPRIAYVGYDNDNLYVAYLVFAPDINKLETTQAKWAANDEVEIIVDPNQAGKVTQYGVTASGVTSSPDIQAAMFKEGSRMAIEVAVPWKALGVSAPVKGDKWGMHLSGFQTQPKTWMSFSWWNKYLVGTGMGVAVFGE